MPVIQPQPGPQLAFLSTPADIAIIGGGNDGGKTFGLLMDAARHVSNPNFEAIYFRRETPNITNPGGLWSEAKKMYGNCTTSVTSPRHQMEFPSGARVSFAHLQHSEDRFSYDGAQIPAIYFDQLEQFEEEQFWHLFGRNRSTCGVKPYIRGSCNPAPESWLAKMISWYWDSETGYAIPERSGVVRWFVRDDAGALHWGDSPSDLAEHVDISGNPLPATSFTFVLALVQDNKLALAVDPGRLTKLMQLPFVERERRLKGNWKIKDLKGDGLIKPDWWQYVKAWPVGVTWWRAWDPASGESKGADFTAGGLCGMDATGKIYLAGGRRGRWAPGARNAVMLATAKLDVAIEAKGCFEKNRNNDMNVAITRALNGYSMWAVPTKGSKTFRADPLAAQAQVGNVYLVDVDDLKSIPDERVRALAKGDWIPEFIEEWANFNGDESNEKLKDDQVDWSSLAFSMCVKWRGESKPKE